jgi:hypothetical protein
MGRLIRLAVQGGKLDAKPETAPKLDRRGFFRCMKPLQAAAVVVAAAELMTPKATSRAT